MRMHEILETASSMGTQTYLINTMHVSMAEQMPECYKIDPSATSIVEFKGSPALDAKLNELIRGGLAQRMFAEYGQVAVTAIRSVEAMFDVPKFIDSSYKNTARHNPNQPVTNFGEAMSSHGGVLPYGITISVTLAWGEMSQELAEFLGVWACTFVMGRDQYDDYEYDTRFKDA